MHEYRTRISENGRLLIPVAYRKALGIKPGDEVVLRLEDNELHISTSKQALKRARQLVRQYVKADESLVDNLISDRRKEAMHE